MAKRIDEAIADLSYRPNVIARRLSRGSSEIIGFVTSDIASPFFAAIASATEEEAERFGYSVMICNTRNQVDRELQYIAKMADAHFDGLIFLTNHVDDGRLRDAVNQAGKIVLIDEDVPGARAPRFFTDNFRGGYAATKHLIEAGHRRICHITGPMGLLSVDERLAGFRRAMAEASLEVDEALIKSGTYNTLYGGVALREIWETGDPPSAIMTTSDLLALSIYQAARELALGIPQDVSIVSFDDLPFVGFLDPPLTTVRQPAAELGRRGVRALLSKTPDMEAIERLPVELVNRGSVARVDLAGEDRPTRRAKLEKQR
ncbi:MAG TPA: LacI family DNA-binding transcriptional regulator [Roseiarcus sp.]|jgi:LacI family transcriptional regulator